MCQEGLSIFVNQCKGLTLFTDKKKIVIDKDSCLNGCYKITYRKTREFPDKSFLTYDEVLFCADKEVLIEIANTIKKELD